MLSHHLLPLPCSPPLPSPPKSILLIKYCSAPHRKHSFSSPQVDDRQRLLVRIRHHVRNQHGQRPGPCRLVGPYVANFSPPRPAHDVPAVGVRRFAHYRRPRALHARGRRRLSSGPVATDAHGRLCHGHLPRAARCRCRHSQGDGNAEGGGVQEFGIVAGRVCQV